MISDPHHDVLIVGGGIAGIEALLAVADLASDGLRLHLVAAHPSFVLRPQILGAPWDRTPVHVDLADLCASFGATFTRGAVTHVDGGARRVLTSSGNAVGYDRLLLAPGGRTSLPYPMVRVLGFGALPHALSSPSRGSVAIVIPPGTTWTLPAYQLALMTAASGERDVRVVTAENAPLEVFGSDTRPAVTAMLHRHGVRVRTGASPEAGRGLAELADCVVALPLVNGPAITGLPLDGGGFIRVDETSMAVVGLDDVFAAGDATDRGIKQGGLAAQQADVAAAAIVRSCGAQPPPAAYAPVLRGMLSAPDGEALYLRRALDGTDPGRASDRALWQPPSVVCAWRLARWLADRRDDLGHLGGQSSVKPLSAA